MASYTEYGVPSEEFLEIAKAFPQPPPDNDDPALMRANVSGILGMLNPSYSGANDCTFKDSTIKIPGAELPIRVYTPKNHTASSPLMVYFHPGGWVLGDLEFGHPNCLNFSSTFDAVIVSVLYRKAPENPYPVPQTDCYEAYKAILAGDLLFNKEKIYVFGGSAGGQLSIYTAIRDLEEGHNRIKGLLLLCPVTVWQGAFPKDEIKGVASWEQNAKSPLLGEFEMNRFTRMLGASEEELKGKYLSPLLLSDDILAKLPKTYIQTYGLDPLRDEGILFAEKIKRAGGEAKWDCYGGWPHCAFMIFWSLPAAQKSLQDLNDNAKWMGL